LRAIVDIDIYIGTITNIMIILFIKIVIILYVNEYSRMLLNVIFTQIKFLVLFQL